MFSKILIANRGEIACRVIKTARRLGIKSVAVYSEADREALHVKMADEAVAIGPPPSSQSYLVIDRLIDACRQSGAEAVHPGYGFVSENPSFAKALAAANIAFIGPPVEAIRAMGDKITSKKIAFEAGVSTVPGYADIISDSEQAVHIARDIGYPVMLKASAGGGGKGMRVAYNDSECKEGFERATSEAISSFGDGRVFIEKFIEQPRHIEIQVLADGHGNALYLGERECSIQRRHQKVIEEAPSPFIDEKTRKAMGEQAVALARAVNYRSAGTVEFIVDKDRNFYFLEMNTRLQVEHPVTELVTGLDLVEWMIRIAAGEALPMTQEAIHLRGWAMEARIYAEDPFRNFLPSIGRLVRFQPPPENDFVRVDTGVAEGGEVSMFYDPMIAKLITYGTNREQARLQMIDALNAFYIHGVSHNISFLAALFNHPQIRQGEMSTNFIAQTYPDGFSNRYVTQENPALVVVVAAVIHRRYMDRAASISGQMSGHERSVGNEWVVWLDEVYHSVVVKPERENHVEVFYRDQHYWVISEWTFGKHLFRGTVNGQQICLQVERHGLSYRLFHNGAIVDTWVMSPRAAKLHALMPKKALADHSKSLLSPMPGLLTQLYVEVGQEVKAGQDLAVIEAMKMENVLKAERDGVVAEVKAAVGDSLSVDQVILAFDES